MSRNRLLPVLFVAQLGVAACGDDQPSLAETSDRFPMTIDSCGRPVTIEEPPERVLTVASVAAPLVAAAGTEEKIIARTFETATFLGEYEDELADVPLVSRTGNSPGKGSSPGGPIS